MDIPEFEYDADKNQRNLEKHGVSFEEAQELWLGNHAIITGKPSKGEDRFIALGILNKQVYMVVFTRRSGRVRLVTCHRADKRMCRLYEESVHEKKES